MWIFEMIFLWLYYSKMYILVSIIITYLLNKITKKLYLPPLIINMVSVILLLLSNKETRTFNMYISYFPTVLTSIIINLGIYLKNFYFKKR